MQVAGQMWIPLIAVFLAIFSIASVRSLVLQGSSRLLLIAM